MGSRLPVVAILVFLLVPLLAGAADDVTFGNNRAGLSDFVRSLTGDVENTYVHDTTYARYLHYALRETRLALGPTTRVDSDTITLTLNRLCYSLRSDAMAGRVGAVLHRQSGPGGAEESFLARVEPAVLGNIGDTPPGAHYAILGSNLCLSQSPGGSETIIVYQLTLPTDLSHPDSTLYISEEDEIAVGFLAAAMTFLDAGNIQAAQLLYGWWQNHLRLKGVGMTQEAPQ